MKNQRRLGVIISYVTLFFSSFFAIFLTPFLIRNLGIVEFGVYQLINSFAGYLVILNFGTGAAITRYVAKYRINNETKNQENFLFIALIITGILSTIILFFGTIMYFNIDSIFSNSLLPSEMMLAKSLLVVTVLNISLTLILNAFNGVLIGYELYFISSSTKLFRIIIRLISIIILLNLGFGSLAIVVTDLLITVIISVFEIYYCMNRLNIKIKFHYFDKVLINSVFTFSLAIFIQSIVNQINQNVDRVILGVIEGPSIVGIYSIALVFFTTFSSVAGILGGVFVPQATQLVHRNASTEELTNLIIRPGRLQFMLAGFIVVGFIVFGENFIRIWVGEEFLVVYIPTIILLIPATIPLIQNVCIAILDAKLKRMVRSLILISMSIINIILTIILVQKYGIIGAAISTALSILIAEIIIMNIYYHKFIGINIVVMFKEIFKGSLKVLVLHLIIFYSVNSLIDNDNNIFILILLILFTGSYVFSLYKFSFNKYEKVLIKDLLNKIQILHFFKKSK